LGSQERFLDKYRTNPEIRRIVKQIDTIENQIATSTAPRQRFQNLLESMYSGNKRIVFSEKEIGVEMLSKGKIDLPSLSSGEKQLFLIALESLKSGDHALIIDEPELSMHVDWQRKLVASLLELNPKMQLIIATHSPEIMADLAEMNIFSL
jgi:predicted ATP-dependent endonuclease of OLD family